MSKTQAFYGNSLLGEHHYSEPIDDTYTPEEIAQQFDIEKAQRWWLIKGSNGLRGNFDDDLYSDICREKDKLNRLI